MARQCPTAPEGSGNDGKCFNCGEEGRVALSSLSFTLANLCLDIRRPNAPSHAFLPVLVVSARSRVILRLNVQTSRQPNASIASKKVEYPFHLSSFIG